MTLELWPCSKCGAPGVKNLGTDGYCETHLTELLRRFDPSVFELSGRWVADGPLRPDHGPGFAECECLACGATAVAVVGDPCAYCDRARERMIDWQAEKVLTPPDGDSFDAWAERLTVACNAGIVTLEEAQRAFNRGWEAHNDVA